MVKHISSAIYILKSLDFVIWLIFFWLFTLIGVFHTMNISILFYMLLVFLPRLLLVFYLCLQCYFSCTYIYLSVMASVLSVPRKAFIYFQGLNKSLLYFILYFILLFFLLCYGLNVCRWLSISVSSWHVFFIPDCVKVFSYVSWFYNFFNLDL